MSARGVLRRGWANSSTGLLAAASLGLSTPAVAGETYSIHGGSPEQQRVVAAALDQLPAELLTCDGNPINIELATEPPTPAWYWRQPWQIPRVNDYLTGTLMGDADSLRRITIDADMVAGPRREERLHHWARQTGMSIQQTRGMLGNTQRVLLHEVAHHYHLHCAKSWWSDALQPFLALRYDALDEAWNNDPLRKRIMDLAAENEKIGGVQGALNHNIMVLALMMRRDELGLPARYAFDHHSVDGSGRGHGTEYFAIAAETAYADPQEFCSVYTQPERDWLLNNVPWFSKISTASSCSTYPPKPAPESTAEDTLSLLRDLNPGGGDDCGN